MEIWKDIVGYEGLYMVSNLGNIKSLERITPHGHRRRERLLYLIPCDYFMVDLCKNNKKTRKSVHRIVAVAFIPNPENKPYINHKDLNKMNNNVSNLEWCTPKENCIHACRNGHKKNQSGEYNSMSKLTKTDVLFIRNLSLEGKTAYKIHKEMYPYLHQQTIYAIIKRRIWKHI